MFIKAILKGNERTVRVKKNIAISIILKGCSIIISFFLVRLTLEYLNSYEYGIWLTLSSILMWINYFDIGLGNGLRNKLTKALSLGDKDSSKIYISTTLFLLIVIMAIVLSLYSIAYSHIDWYKLLDIPYDSLGLVNFNSLVYVVLLLFCLSFVLKIIGIIYISMQMTSINDFLLFCSHVLSLIGIFALTRASKGSIFYIAIIYSFSPVLVYLVAWLITSIKIPWIRPSLSFINVKYTKDLIGVGIIFFIIQISSIVIFSSSNILIIRLLGPECVTLYNITSKYFSIILFIFNIVISPIWSAVTDAYIKDDFKWIKNAMKKINYIYIYLVMLTLLLILLSGMVYKIWIGSKIQIPFSLTVFSGIYIIILTWSNVYVNFINGIGKLKIELINSIVLTVLYFPLAILGGNLFGLNGIILAMCVVCIQGGILFPIQYKKIVNKTANGIWNE
jgi:O-antigen/teichoic acid export membrane protein